jgi:hypothetical protein
MKKRSIRTAHLSVEALESRITPAVTVGNVGADLVITGNADADNIRVQVSSGSVSVVGVGGTQVNFAAGFNAAAFSDDVFINLGAGNDTVEVLNSGRRSQVGERQSV